MKNYMYKNANMFGYVCFLKIYFYPQKRVKTEARKANRIKSI